MATGLLPPAEPLVLLPGMNCSPALWAPVLADLPFGDGRAVFALELTGSSIDACVAEVLALAPPRFALAGLSLGGIVAMALVRQAPERLSRLALLSTNARPPTPEQYAGWAATRAALRAGATARQVQQDLLPVLLSPAAASPDLVERTLVLADQVGTQALDAQLAAQQSRLDERPGLAGVRVPTLVVAAELDALCGVDRHTEIAALVPGSELVVLPGVGHLSPLEAPGLIAGLLHQWRSGRAGGR